MDAFQDEASLIAVAGHRQASQIAQMGLLGLTHRGKATTGIACSDGTSIRCLRSLGTDVLASPNSQLENLKGKLAIGQIGGLNNQTGQLERNHDVQVDQPLTVRWQGGQLALAMSGRLTNGFRLRTELQEDGAVFSTASEVEVLAHLIARAHR